VALRAASVGILFFLIGAAQAAPPALDEARALQQKGALAEAQKAYEALLPQLRSSDRVALGAALNELSRVASAQGQYAAAAAAAREAVEVHRSLGDRRGEAHALHRLGVAELYQGHYPAALGLLQQALAIARDVGDREREVEELNNIGSVHFQQARYLDALRAYREALDGVGRPETASAAWSRRLRRITLTNLAALFQRVGQDEQAIQLYTELRNTPEALKPSEQARLLSNLGDLYRRLGDPIKALETYRIAQDLLAGDEHRQARIRVLVNIGTVQALDMGELPVAVATFSGALALAQQSGDQREAMYALLYRGESRRRQGDVEGAARDFEAALALSEKLGASDERWKALFGLGRLARAAHRDEVAYGHFRDAISAIESVRAQLQLASLKSDFLAAWDKRDVYDALLEIVLERGDSAAFFEVLERARARTFQDRLALSQPTLPAVQARLGKGAILLEYWIAPRGAAVLWATRDGVGIVRLPAPDPVEISSLLDEASSGSSDGWKGPAATLGARLLRGIPALGQPGAAHLLVVPDGILGEVPFELLDAGGGSPIVERFDVSYLPSAAVLLRASSRSTSWKPPWTRQLVAFAAPRVQPDSRGAGIELGGPELDDPLPASAEEARAIARACPGRARLFIGDANLKKDLVEGAASGVSLLHLATHAVADLASAERSRIVFSAPDAKDGVDYLFLKEVYDLELSGVDLATLSACETERGKFVKGEGAAAFSRALLSAGARATVTTLWRVADEPARDFMAQLYFELNRGKPKAEALRLAKLRFLRSGTALRHPRYWAAFILTGDGGTPIPQVYSWSTVLGVTGILFLGIGVAAAVVRNRAGPGSAGAALRRTG